MDKFEGEVKQVPGKLGDQRPKTRLKWWHLVYKFEGEVQQVSRKLAQNIINNKLKSLNVAQKHVCVCDVLEDVVWC